MRNRTHLGKSIYTQSATSSFQQCAPFSAFRSYELLRSKICLPAHKKKKIKRLDDKHSSMPYCDSVESNRTDSSKYFRPPK